MCGPAGEEREEWRRGGGARGGVKQIRRLRQETREAGLNLARKGAQRDRNKGDSASPCQQCVTKPKSVSPLL